MYILPENPFNAYIANLRAKPINLPKFMIVTYASRALSYILNASDDELHKLTDECPIQTRCYKFNLGLLLEDV